MRYRHTLAGLGWAGTLGGLALCVLIFLSASLAFDDRPGVTTREDSIVRLRSVPDAEVASAPLARPLQAGATPTVGTELGRISPPAGQVIHNTGDALGDAVDALTPPPPPGR